MFPINVLTWISCQNVGSTPCWRYPITIKLRKVNTPKQENVHFLVLGRYKILKLMGMYGEA
ncbi:hypothetical protein COL30_14050 [Bacillus pseudomycoides]|nr:hypothetical protein COO19_22690 [Bacillus pseudomycoides]PEI95565.1 hypothetical protein CN686_13750 [Bacillus pseudomycoides]PEK30001.1 hypothetical protein CN693_00265 [Bacillus pseudomycoides]PEM70416.1 hypothetical protein CN619_19745 [Bacillus pseudomycoides]PEO07956.1 hypothetical protein CN542_26070 [Bacillus pseudomycoides]